MVWVFTNDPGDWVSIPGWVILKTQKWYLMPTCLTLSILRYGSRVSKVIQGKEKYPLLHLGVVAIEKGAFRSSLTMASQLIYIYIYIYICKHCVCMSIQKYWK